MALGFVCLWFYKLQIWCGVLLYLDPGWAKMRRSQTARDHKFASEFHKNESENAPARPKLSRRFSVSWLSPPVNASPGHM